MRVGRRVLSKAQEKEGLDAQPQESDRKDKLHKKRKKRRRVGMKRSCLQNQKN
jgi:hypothetical protein